MSHQDSYLHNTSYAEFLAGWDPAFYGKFSDTLRPAKSGGRVLDVGCGVGQVVDRLSKAGFDALGVDVSEPNIERSRVHCPNCRMYDGRSLPFPDEHFDSVGALNVLEHVEEPEAFLREMVRVTVPGGKVVVSSPNFYRVLGYRDYHHRMRGLGNKWRNLQRLLQKLRQMKHDPESVRFDRMTPVVKEPFTPDDDAIVATNPIEIMFFLRRNGCEITDAACTDRYVAAPIDFLLNLLPTRFVMFNGFIVARRSPLRSCY